MIIFKSRLTRTYLLILILFIPSIKIKGIGKYQNSKDTINPSPHATHTTGLNLPATEWDLMDHRTVSIIQKFQNLKTIRQQVNSRWLTFNKDHSHTFMLKFQLPEYGAINTQNNFLKENILAKDGALSTYKYSHPRTTNTDPSSNIQKFNESIFISSPQLVQWDWNKIPSPHRLVFDGKMLNKKAAQEAFKTSKVETPRKVQKPNETSKTWTYSGIEALQLSESFFENWVKGGDNSIALLSDLRINSLYKHKKLEWDNKLIHKLGIISQEDQRTRINDDVIQITSKLGMSASKKWYYSVLGDFKTQFFYGRDSKDYSNILSGFMSPGYQTFAIGMDYKRSKDFTILISPITSKVTYVLDTVHIDASRYDITDGKRSNAETGLSVTSNITTKISAELTLTSNLEYFYSYLDDEGKSQLEWEVIINMRINKYLSTRLVPRIRYYQNESEDLQFKQNLTIAFNYTL